MQQASTQISRHTLQITQRITKVKTKKQLNMCYPSCISKRKIMLTWLEFNIIRAILQKTSFEEQYWPCLIGRNNNYAVWRKGCVALKAVSPLPRVCVCVCVCPPLFVEFLPTCSIRTEESHSEWIHETCWDLLSNVCLVVFVPLRQQKHTSYRSQTVEVSSSES